MLIPYIRVSPPAYRQALLNLHTSGHMTPAESFLTPLLWTGLSCGGSGGGGGGGGGCGGGGWSIFL